MFSSAEINYNLNLLHEMFSCNTLMYYWTYDPDLHLLDTNCKDLILNTIFEKTGCQEYLYEYGCSHTTPLLLSAPLGLMWSAAFEYHDNTLNRIHLLGPIFTTEVSKKGIADSLKNYDISIIWKKELVERLTELPMVSSINFFQYTLMLHYAVTGEKLHISDVQFQEFGDSKKYPSLSSASNKDRHHVWQTEQALMQMIREGNLNYKAVFDLASTVSQGVQITTGDPMQQIRTTYTVFISLSVRAAIDGGLSPDTAYTLGDHYIQSIIDCKTVSEAMTIGHTMYEDFIQRVHKYKCSQHVSQTIQSCCDYIQMHIEDELSLKDIAKHFGYTDYYFSKKFKKEMGVSFNEYLKKERIRHAQTLLRTTSLSLQEIRERLHFCSRTYFTDAFKSVVGVSPSDYRKQYDRY